MTFVGVQLRLRNFTRLLLSPGIAQSIIRTAGFNAAATATSGLGGIILARSIGPTGRGEYAAITSWLGVALIIADLGQPAALCYYASRDPRRAADYVGTSRSMMIASGFTAVIASLLLAPILGHHYRIMVIGYEIAIGGLFFALIGTSYLAALQARNLYRWNLMRSSQGILGGIALIILWATKSLTLYNALLVMTITIFAQTCLAYSSCRQAGLAPGHIRASMLRPLTTYGVAQIAAIAPATVNLNLDQLILSQTVPPSDLGRYAVAVSLTSLPIPLISAIGNVTFPHLAAQTQITPATQTLQRRAVVGSLIAAAAFLIPLAAAARWLVPLVFGPAFTASVPLLWILVPGAILLAANQVAGDLLRGRNYPKVVASSQAVAAAVTVLLLAILLPIIGVYGAAITSTIAYGLAFALMVRRLFLLPADRPLNSTVSEAATTSRTDRYILPVKRLLTRYITSRLACRAISVVTHNRVRHHGLRFDVESPDFSPRIRAEIFMGIYVSAATDMVQTVLRDSTTVIELGSGLGITTAHILASMESNGRLICVEANPNLITGLRSRLKATSTNVQIDIVHAAVASRTGQVPFTVVSEIVASRFAQPHESNAAIRVPSLRLRDLVTKFNLRDYDLVSDIEGAEASFLVNDPDILRDCRRVVIELHNVVTPFASHTVQELLDAATANGFRILERRGRVVALERVRG